MALTENEVKKIAKLARIGLKDNDLALYTEDLTRIMDMIEQLLQIDTTNVPALTSVSETTLPMREDIVTTGNIAAEIVKNAPAKEYNCFVVPKVIE